MVSHGFARLRSVPFGFAMILLVSVVSLGWDYFRQVSPGVAEFRFVSLGFARFRSVSFGFAWFRLAFAFVITFRDGQNPLQVVVLMRPCVLSPPVCFSKSFDRVRVPCAWSHRNFRDGCWPTQKCHPFVGMFWSFTTSARPFSHGLVCLWLLWETFSRVKTADKKFSLETNSCCSLFQIHVVLPQGPLTKSLSFFCAPSSPPCSAKSFDDEARLCWLTSRNATLFDREHNRSSNFVIVVRTLLFLRLAGFFVSATGAITTRFFFYMIHRKTCISFFHEIL